MPAWTSMLEFINILLANFQHVKPPRGFDEEATFDMATKNLLSSLKGLTDRFRAKPDEVTMKESRVYQRFDLTHSTLFRAQLPDGSSAPILNLSFGGMRLGTEHDADNIPIVIRVLGRTLPSQIGVTHRGSKFIGSRFDKADPALLKFLQPLLEALEHGLSLRKIAATALKESTKERYELILRGEGPTDLLLASLSDPTPHMILTFRVEKEYLELTLKDDRIATARTTDLHGVAARMSLDKAPDPKTIEQSLLILTGAMAQEDLQKALGPIADTLRKHLQA